MKKSVLILLNLFFFISVFSQKSEVENLPGCIDLKDSMPQIKDQDYRSSCSYFAVMALIETEIKRVYHKEVNLSEQFVIYNSKQDRNCEYPNTECSGPGENFNIIKKYGLLYEQSWPYQPSYFLKGYPCCDLKEGDSKAKSLCYAQQKPPKQVLKQAFTIDLNFKLLENNLDSVLIFLANEKKPLTFRFPMDDYNWTDSGQVYYNDSILAIEEAAGDRHHISVISGYDLNKQIFFIHNSYGTAWGKEGYGTLSFENFKKYAGEYLYYVTIGNPNKYILPPPPEEPKFEYKNIQIKHQKNTDQSINITFTGEMKNIGWHSIITRSILVTIPNDGAPEMIEDSAEYIELTDKEKELYKDGYPRVVYVNLPQAFLQKLIWTDKDPLKLTISKELLQYESVKNSIKDGKRRLALISSVYYFDEVDNFKKLKRAFYILQ
jgi:hypothetical protein